MMTQGAVAGSGMFSEGWKWEIFVERESPESEEAESWREDDKRWKREEESEAVAMWSQSAQWQEYHFGCCVSEVHRAFDVSTEETTSEREKVHVLFMTL